MKYSIRPNVRKILEECFVEERDLIDELRENPGKPDPLDSGTYVASFFMTVRRPLDLETAELRNVEVRMRARSDGYEIVSIEGLARA